MAAAEMSKVLHVSDCYLPRLGGIETQVHALARQQALAGGRPEVITATPRHPGERTRPGRPGREQIDGVVLWRALAGLPFELPLHPRAGREVAAVLAAARADGDPFQAAHVHVGAISQFAWAALPVLLREGLPVLVTGHSMWGPVATRAATAANLRGHLAGPVRDGRVVLSSVSSVAAQRISQSLGLPGEMVRVIPNGIDAAQWQVDQVPLSERREVLLVAVQRLALRKRGLPLLEVLTRIRGRVGPVVDGLPLRAVVVGDGPARQAMQRRIALDDLAGWVQLPGRWDTEQIRELYRTADVFISPAELESFGIAALEARTAGVPVVARTGTGTSDFVTDGVHGRLAADDDGLAAAVVDLIRDRPGRAEMMRRCREQAPSSDWPQVLAACQDAYAAAHPRP